MRSVSRLFAVVLALSSTLAGATKIPLGAEGQSLTLNFQLQTWLGVTEKGALNGEDLGFDMRLRRVRAALTGEPTDTFAFLLQLDSPNFGFRQDFTPRLLVQDAWVSYAPTGRTAGTVLMVDAGFLLLPISRQLLSSTTSFTTIDVHTDAVRGFREGPGLRDLGVSLRGWTLDKKVGFRGGIYHGVSGTPGAFSATNPRAGLNPKSHPRLAGFVNVNLLGTEEGGWLYQGIYFAEQPIVSVGVGGAYQSLAAHGPTGITDTRVASADVFADIPVSGEQEAIVHATGYRNSFGAGAPDTGWGYFADIGYRYKFAMLYVSDEGFSGDACPEGLAAPECTARTADSNIVRAGLDFFINKNVNHVKLEYSNGRSLLASNAARLNSLLVQWNTVF
ncbi:hypothetical protein POL68_32070 [Stigmatella sp. ncwal1]|uniref:Porin n=1 Tax=Stigmatella ashevillensis TaxID=2995309 RepID=A0ABT5DHJ8_9BACT|nr:hypothetical protein [Stigmatella ashevillena]MDC0713142.1 hypothetical protein [Stigmatella ashevillena]